jgi:hypothetical protein
VSYTLSQLEDIPGQCLPEPIEPDANCKLLTARKGAACSCSEPGLTTSTSSVTKALQKQLQLVGYCGAEGQPPCGDTCACEVSRAIGTSLIECKTLPEPSAESAGWCYVSADAGQSQAQLVAHCPSTQQQTLRFMGDPRLLAGVPSFLACAEGTGTPPPRDLGEVCFGEAGNSRFPGYSVSEVNIYKGATSCSSGVCVMNHFQGLVTCPYGQAAEAGDCLAPGSEQAVSVAVKPQLVERQAAIASICSCQCDGPGLGPYCTCPESMQCEHLVDDLGLGTDLAGSYCIPKGTAFDSQASRTDCVEPNCGAAHPY